MSNSVFSHPRLSEPKRLKFGIENVNVTTQLERGSQCLYSTTDFHQPDTFYDIKVMVMSHIL